MKVFRKILVLLIAMIFIVSGCKKRSLKTEEVIGPNDFLSDKKYEKLVVTIVYEKGFALNAKTIAGLQAFLSARLNKPNGIIFNEKEIPDQGKRIVTISDIRNIEKQFRTDFSGKSTLTAFVYVSAGDYAESAGNSKILGIAYGNTSMALFGKMINSYSGGLTQPPRSMLETIVIDHEFGHLFGLVDNGTKMIDYHRDIYNGHHCDKRKCLMYHTAETSDVVANLLSDDLPVLENFCIRDLQYNGGK